MGELEEDEVIQRRPDRVLVRRGSVVWHPQHPWSAATRQLLARLEAVGFPYSSRLIGQRDGYDLLGWIPGTSGADGWASVVPEDGLAAFGRLLRAYHDAVAGWVPEVEPVWFDGTAGVGAPGQVVCHRDFGPWNVVWEGTRPVGLLDFEYASPGDPLEDVAFALEYVVPFRDDATCLRWLRYPSPPDRRRRLALFARTYGLTSADGLVDRVIAGQRRHLDVVVSLAERGDTRQVAQVADGYLDELQDRIDWSLGLRDALLG